jgi:hypothetical protein
VTSLNGADTDTTASTSPADVGYWQILLQKSAISTAKRLTRFFEAHVAGCSMGSGL